MKKKISIGKDISLTIDLDTFTKIRVELEKNYASRVGVLGQKTNRIPMLAGESHQRYKMRVKTIMAKNPKVQQSSEKTNAEIGLKQEMGSLSDHIPRRSFLEMPLTMKMPDYYKTFGETLKKAFLNGDIRPAYVKLGLKGEQVVQLAFASRGFGIWPDNAPSTIARKKSSQPLIDTAQLRRSITSDVVSK